GQAEELGHVTSGVGLHGERNLVRDSLRFAPQLGERYLALAFFLARAGASFPAFGAAWWAGIFSSVLVPRLARLAFNASIRSMILVCGPSTGSAVMSWPSTLRWMASSTRSRTWS